MVDDVVIKSRIKLVIDAGKASPGPKIASVLGPRGVPMPKFCKEFNEYTSNGSNGPYDIGDPVTVQILVYGDKSKTYTFLVSDSPVSYLLKKSLSLSKGSSSPGKEVISSISIADVRCIAKRKMGDMNAHTLESAVKMVTGTAKSMGIAVEYDSDV